MKFWRISLFILLVMFAANGFGQGNKWRHTWTEILAGGGTSKMFSDMESNSFGYGFHAGARFKIQRYWTLKTEASYFSMAGADRPTGYSYRTWMIEPAVTAEFHFFNRQERNIGYNKRELILWEAKMTGYAFVGIAGLYINPVTSGGLTIDFDDNAWRISIAYPVGLGYKYSLNDYFSVGIETGIKFTRTDYLDGYSPVGDSSRDKFFFAQAGVSYKLNLKRVQGLY